MVRLPLIEVISFDHDDKTEDDRARLEAVLEGDLEAEREFVEQYLPLIQSCVRRLSRSHGAWVTEDDVNDIVGEVWVSLWENDKLRLRRFDPARKVKISTWVHLLARNRTIDWLRARSARPVTIQDPDRELELAALTPSPAEQVELRESLELAVEALGKLSEEEQRFMRAWYTEERDSQAMAERLGIAITTVYTRRFKIVAKLARMMDRMEQRRTRSPN